MKDITEINNFFRNRKGKLDNFSTFKKTGLYDHYNNLFGPLVYTEEKTYDFMGLDKQGYLYNDIYYPYGDYNKKGTIIPKIFLEQDLEVTIPDPVWEKVATQGYAEVNGVEMDDSLGKKTLDEAYIPYGINPELDMSDSIYQTYFANLSDYDIPEKHKYVDYMKQITEKLLSQIPLGQPVINSYVHHTADMVKYLYRKDDPNCKKGPYTFHTDYFSRCLFMLFIYFSRKSPIEGRELLVGKRDNFVDFSKESLNLTSEPKADTNPFSKVSDDRVSNPQELAISDKTVVLINTLNPMFVHRVNKLRKDNEVVLMCSYLWSKSWDKV